MLNEIWRLWQALEKANIKTDNIISHRLIASLPKADLLRVRLNKDGHVSSVENITNEEVIGLWRIVASSDGSFPVIKVSHPFLESPPDATLDTSANMHKKKIITKLSENGIKIEDCRPWREAGHDWAESSQKAKKITEVLKGNKDGKLIVDLAERFQKALEIPAENNPGKSKSEKGDTKTQTKLNRFIYQICNTALNCIRTGRLENEKAITTVYELLIGKGKDKKGNEKKLSILLVLDLDGGESIYTDDIKRAVAYNFPTDLTPEKRKNKHYAEQSAFGGYGTLLEEPFPKVNLDFLGKFPLISMAGSKGDDECNKRYGMTGYTIYPVTKVQSGYLEVALKSLLDYPRGTTWRGVASGLYDSAKGKAVKKVEKQDLLIVFVDEKPKIEAQIANIFGSDQDIIESQFAVDAKAVSDALDGVLKEIPESKLNLFLIRNITKGQVQVVLSRSIKVKDVLMRAENWNKAVRENTPKLTLDLPSGKDSKKNIISAIQGASPITPYPDQVVRLLSRQWTRDGSSPIGTDGKPQKASHEVIGLSFGDVIDFMLRAEGKWEPTARRIINLLIQRITPLLIGVFGAKHCYGPRHLQGLPEPISDYPRDSRQTALQAVAIMGIILDALELRKEKYMKDAAFQVGQVLSLADTLHKDYCIVERKGQMPNSLIGTSLMRRALDSPAGALSDLAERMMEYVRWAKVAGISQDWFKDDSGRNKTIAVNEARKKLRQYQSLADSLASCDLPIECNDVMKAQLLLGFMASQPDDDENKE